MSFPCKLVVFGISLSHLQLQLEKIFAVVEIDMQRESPGKSPTSGVPHAFSPLYMLARYASVEST